MAMSKFEFIPIDIGLVAAVMPVLIASTKEIMRRLDATQKVPRKAMEITIDFKRERVSC